MRKLFTLFFFIFMSSHCYALNPNPYTAQVTGVSLTNNNTQIVMTVTLTNSSGTITVNLAPYAYNNNSIQMIAELRVYLQGLLDAFNGKTLSDYATTLESITFSSTP